MEPATECALPTELRQLLPRFHKNLCRQLSPSRLASRQSRTQRVDAAEVPPVQALERFVVSLRCKCRVCRIPHQSDAVARSSSDLDQCPLVPPIRYRWRKV